MLARNRPLAMLVLGIAVAVWTSLAIGARATEATRTTADEPQYLTTALSLAEDHDLDIANQMSAREYRPFHEITLWDQTEPRADGSRVAPHDPLLPLLLAPFVGAAGWIAGKVFLAFLAGALAALLYWTAVERFAVRPLVAMVVIGSFALSMPLASYATQVYPELPAALAVTAAIAALTGPMRRGGQAVVLAALIALPWLSVKYAPVVVGLVAVAAWQLWSARRRHALAVGALVLGVAGVAYLLAHQAWYGGWTVYAAGNHFTEGGELSVMGYTPDYIGRSIRWVGLLVDRGFGLVTWAPIFLLLVPAVAAVGRRRPVGWAVLLVPLAAGWINAVYVAQTMQGWWMPGRQVVVVVPCVVLAVAWWCDRLRRGVPLAAVLGALGAMSWLWLTIDVLAGNHTLVVDLFDTSALPYAAIARVVPNGLAVGPADVVAYVVWAAMLVLLAVIGWRSVGERAAPSGIDHAQRRDHQTSDNTVEREEAIDEEPASRPIGRRAAAGVGAGVGGRRVQ